MGPMAPMAPMAPMRPMGPMPLPGPSLVGGFNPHVKKKQQHEYGFSWEKKTENQVSEGSHIL